MNSILKKIISTDNCVVRVREDGCLDYCTNTNISEEEKKTILGWENIASAIIYGDCSVLAVKADGGLVASNSESIEKEHEILKWNNIKQIIEYGMCYIVLFFDGTIEVSWSKYLVSGVEPEWYTEIKQWKDIEHVVAGEGCILGLKNDGTVVIAVTTYESDMYDISGWKDIQYITCYEYLIAGVRKDGRVVVSGKNVYYHEEGESFYDYDISTSSFWNMKSVEVSNDVIVGIKWDGSVVHVLSENESPVYPILGRISEWKNIQEISLIRGREGTEFIIGINNNGKIFASHFVRGGDLAIQQIKEEVLKWNLD